MRVIKWRRTNRIWIKTYSEGRDVMINGWVFQQSVIMKKRFGFEILNAWNFVLHLSLCKGWGLHKYFWFSQKKYTLASPPPLPPVFFLKVLEQYISWASGPSKKVMRAPKPSDSFFVQCRPCSSEDYPNDSWIRTYVLLLGISYYVLLTRIK